MESKKIREKKPVLTFILFLLLGKLGLHRFYVGKYITGAVFFLVGGTAIVMRVMEMHYAFLVEIASAILMIIDLYLLCANRFMDKRGNLMVQGETVRQDANQEEKSKVLFIDRISKLIYISCSAALYIGYCLIYNFL